MAAKKVHIRVVTPTGVLVDDHVDLAIMRCITGDLGVMGGHESRSGVLDYGVLRLVKGSKERQVAVHGGLVKILKAEPTQLTILTDAAERSEKIDLERAKAKLSRSQSVISEKADDESAVSHAKVSQKKALVRIEVASVSAVSDAEWNEEGG